MGVSVPDSVADAPYVDELAAAQDAKMFEGLQWTTGRGERIERCVWRMWATHGARFGVHSVIIRQVRTVHALNRFHICRTNVPMSFGFVPISLGRVCVHNRRTNRVSQACRAATQLFKEAPGASVESGEGLSEIEVDDEYEGDFRVHFDLF